MIHQTKPLNFTFFCHVWIPLWLAGGIGKIAERSYVTSILSRSTAVRQRMLLPRSGNRRRYPGTFTLPEQARC